MKVSRNAYYHWEKNKDYVVEKASRVLLKEKIQFIFNQSRQIYGSHRIQKMLERERLFYNRSYVALLMREMGLKSILRRKYTVTTDSNHTFDISENKLNREFSSSKLGENWFQTSPILGLIMIGITKQQQWNLMTEKSLVGH